MMVCSSRRSPRGQNDSQPSFIPNNRVWQEEERCKDVLGVRSVRKGHKATWKDGHSDTPWLN